LEAIENARDSVIHHGAAAEFKNHRRGTIAIVEKFIADSSNGELRVAINMEILNTIANQIKQQANIWFREIQGKLK
jgi:hypothetical protein